MIDETARDRKMEKRAHDLYWNSDLSVNTLAEKLGVSKGQLYQLIQPLPVEGQCDQCGGDLAFEHRTARSRGDAICVSCGAEIDVPAGEPLQSATTGTRDSLSENSRKLIAGLALGAVVGVVLVWLLRR